MPIGNEELNEIRRRRNEKLLFSFKFFDRGHEAFNLAGTNKVCDNWFLCLFDSLKDVSDITRDCLVIEKRQHYDAHKHNWDNLKYRFHLHEQFLEQVECMQFRISQARGRVHGFILGNRFYIVWFDPHHNLYPDPNYGGEKLFNSPPSCYDILLQENLKLKREIENKETEICYIKKEYDHFLTEHELALKEIERNNLEKQIQEDKLNTKKKNKEKYNRKVKKGRK